MGVGSYEPSENTGYAVVSVIVVMIMAVIVIIMLVTWFGHRSSLVADSRLCTLRAVRNRLVLAVTVGDEEGDPEHRVGGAYGLPLTGCVGGRRFLYVWQIRHQRTSL